MIPILLLDNFAPYRKLSKKEIKLKTKPWINKYIEVLMKKRDKKDDHLFCKNYRLCYRFLAKSWKFPPILWNNFIKSNPDILSFSQRTIKILP